MPENIRTKISTNKFEIPEDIEILILQLNDTFTEVEYFRLLPTAFGNIKTLISKSGTGTDACATKIYFKSKSGNDRRLLMMASGA